MTISNPSVGSRMWQKRVKNSMETCQNLTGKNWCSYTINHWWQQRSRKDISSFSFSSKKRWQMPWSETQIRLFRAQSKANCWILCASSRIKIAPMASSLIGVFIMLANKPLLSSNKTKLFKVVVTFLSWGKWHFFYCHQWPLLMMVVNIAHPLKVEQDNKVTFNSCFQFRKGLLFCNYMKEKISTRKARIW